MFRLLLAAAFAALLALPVVAQGFKPGDDPVIAKVDGTEVRLSDVFNAQRSLPAEYRELPLQLIYTQLLDKVIDRKLAANAGRKEKLQESEGFKRQLAFATEGILEQTWMRKQVEKAVSEETLRQRFAKAIADWKGEDEVSARHILVETENDARAIVKQLEGGADFAKIAREKSIDPSAKQNGGDLGYFPREAMVKEFSEAAFTLKVGQISAPVKSKFGWHVIKLDGRRPAPPPSFDEAADQLRDEISREVMAEATKKLRAGAKIETFDPFKAPEAKK